MNRVLRFFGSRRLTIWLVVALALAAVAGSLVPQQARVEPRVYQEWAQANPRWVATFEALGLQRLFTSPWFLSLCGLLLVNLLVTFVPRLARTWAAFREERAHRFQAGQERASIALAEPWPDFVGRAGAVLKRSGYQVREATDELSAVKRLGGLWGATGFHLGLLLTCAGVLVSVLTRFEGLVELVEGQAFADAADGYVVASAGPASGGHDARYGFTVDDFTADFWERGRPRTLESRVRAHLGDETTSAVVRYNSPLDLGGYRLYQGRAHGWAALFTFRQSGAAAASEGFVNFAQPSKGTEVTSNHFVPPGSAVTVRAQLVDAGDTARPPLGVTYWLGGGAAQAEGFLPAGGSVQLQDGELGLLRFAPWSSYVVVRDRGVLVVYAGFTLVLLSLGLLYMWVPARVRLVREQATRVSVFGRVDRYEPAFREELLALAARLGHPPDGSRS